MSKTRTSSSPKGASPKGALRSAVTAGALMLGVAGLSAGCLDRPVQPQEPNTSNVFVKTVPTSSIDKIDLLFMIDNSISMADKQEILKEAVPNLLRRLIEPDCFDAQGVNQPKGADGQCPSGSKFEFSPINNIHIGAITSALGAHGGTRCTGNNDPAVPSFPNDKAQLLPTVRTGLAAEPAGFLAWTGGDSAAVTNLVDTFRTHVEAASEYGCGYEASLEAVYRFLIDPNPPVEIVRNEQTGNQNQPVLVAPADNPVLLQRDAFLRSDSLVAIVMLSDENDCSILDVQSGWAVSSDDYAFSPVSETCDTNPNDKCCYSCAFGAPTGCGDSARCTGAPLPPEQNRANVRCAQQKKRFGFDLLWPVQRYIDGLTQTTIRDYWLADQPEVPNPLFMARNGASPRNQSLVFLAGIVGVPWQDLATADTVDPNAGLRYQSAAEMRANGVWDVILGDQGNGVLPTDPLMVESIAPRTGTHPITGEAISLTGWSNQVNGNEYDNTKGAFPGDTQPLPPNDDLQYACVFELTTPVDCSLPENADACDCADNLEKGKSLCMQGPGSAAGTTQYHAKAYPGTRFLEVLKGMGEVNAGIDNAIVASICPKHPVNPANPTDASAGYNPAVGAIIDRLGEVLGGQCLPRELDIENGRVPCYVIEASTSLNDPGCAKAGRKPVDDQVAGAVRRQLDTEGYCGNDIGVPCSTVAMCEIQQLTEEPGRGECFNEANPSVPGYCYIDPGKGPDAGGQQCDANGQNCVNQFTEDCPASGKRILRFVSGPGDAKIPANGAIMLTACVDS